MAKVFGIHEVTLRPGVTEGEFERSMAEVAGKWPQLEGWTNYVVKGDRGEHVGRYLLIYAVESVEARDRYFPQAGTPSEEAQRAMESSAGVFDRLNELATTVFTDYVELVR